MLACDACAELIALILDWSTWGVGGVGVARSCGLGGTGCGRGTSLTDWCISIHARKAAIFLEAYYHGVMKRPSMVGTFL